MALTPLFGMVVDHQTQQQSKLSVAPGSTLIIDPKDAASMSLYFVGGATGGGLVVVEGTTQDGQAGWLALPLSPISGGATVTSTPVVAANTPYGFRLDVSGLKAVRLRVGGSPLGSELGDLSWTLHTAPTVVPQSATVVTPVTPTKFAMQSTASTNAASIKSTPGVLYSVVATNTAAAPAAVKLYDKAGSGAPSPAADVPLLVVPLAPGEMRTVDLGAVGLRFTGGLSICVVGSATTSDTSNAPAGVVITASLV